MSAPTNEQDTIHWDPFADGPPARRRRKPVGQWGPERDEGPSASDQHEAEPPLIVTPAPIDLVSEVDTPPAQTAAPASEAAPEPSGFQVPSDLEEADPSPLPRPVTGSVTGAQPEAGPAAAPGPATASTADPQPRPVVGPNSDPLLGSVPDGFDDLLRFGAKITAIPLHKRKQEIGSAAAGARFDHSTKQARGYLHAVATRIAERRAEELRASRTDVGAAIGRSRVPIEWPHDERSRRSYVKAIRSASHPDRHDGDRSAWDRAEAAFFITGLVTKQTRGAGAR